ncbi:MAG: hypothetical protein KKF44_03845 [Nanoarchaeota archaeon]|nr:hypothetical protein [Nanoarchaeota archaeon]
MEKKNLFMLAALALIALVVFIAMLTIRYGEKAEEVISTGEKNTYGDEILSQEPSEETAFFSADDAQTTQFPETAGLSVELMDDYSNYIEMGENNILDLEQRKKTLNPALTKIADEKIIRLKKAVDIIKNYQKENPDILNIDPDLIRQDKSGNINLKESIYEINHRGYWGDDSYILGQIEEGRTIIPVTAASDAEADNQLTAQAFRVISNAEEEEPHFSKEIVYTCLKDELKNYKDLLKEKKLLIFYVEGSLYDSISGKLSRYADEIMSESEYCVTARICSDCSRHDIRDELRYTYNDPGLYKELAGAVLFGDIPLTWFRVYQHEIADGVNTFVTDMFYMDLDGEWITEDGTRCMFDDYCANHYNDKDTDDCNNDNYCYCQFWTDDNICLTCLPDVDCESIEIEEECKKNDYVCWWKTEDDLQFVEHNGDRSAEIFVSRINPLADDDYDQSKTISKFLDKLSKIKTGKIFLDHNAVWVDYLDGLPEQTIIDSLQNLYPNSFDDKYQYFKSADGSVVKKAGNVYESFYQNSELAFFETKGNQYVIDFPEDGDMGGNEISVIKPRFFILILQGSPVNMLDSDSFLGRKFLFYDNSYVSSLLAGNTYTSTLDPSLIIDALSAGQDIGNAFKTEINERIARGEENNAWTAKDNYLKDYGNILIGDPTMKTNYYKAESAKVYSRKIKESCYEDEENTEDCCSYKKNKEDCICAFCEWGYPGFWSYVFGEKTCIKKSNFFSRFIKKEKCADNTLYSEDLMKYCGVCRINSKHKIYEEGENCDEAFIMEEINPLLFPDKDGNYYACFQGEWKKSECKASLVTENYYDENFYSYADRRAVIKDEEYNLMVTDDESCFPVHDKTSLKRCSNLEWSDCTGCYTYWSYYNSEGEGEWEGYRYAYWPENSKFGTMMAYIYEADKDKCYPVEGQFFQAKCTNPTAGIWEICPEPSDN